MAATDQLNNVMLALYVQYAQNYHTVRGDEPVEWRAATGFGDTLLHVTATELRELTKEVNALLARYDDRDAGRAKRPPGSRPVRIIQMAVPRGPIPREPASGDGP